MDTFRSFPCARVSTMTQLFQPVMKDNLRPFLDSNTAATTLRWPSSGKADGTKGAVDAIPSSFISQWVPASICKLPSVLMEPVHHRGKALDEMAGR